MALNDFVTNEFRDKVINDLLQLPENKVRIDAKLAGVLRLQE